MDTVLTWFIRIWTTLWLALNLSNCALLIIVSPSVRDAYDNLTTAYGPHNFRQHMEMMGLLSPAIVAFLWRAHRRVKRAESR